MASIVGHLRKLERRLIGQRTREVLAAKKAAGVQLGRRRELPDDVVQRIAGERAGGSSLRAIAETLNQARVPTAHGGARCHASTVRAVLASAKR